MNIYEIITNNLIERVEKMIENGETSNWLCPWQKLGLPKSYVSEKTYSGINLWLLESGHYLTWNQYLDIKKHLPEVNLKKGSKSHMCVYFNYKEVEDEESGEIKNIPYLKYYRLFKADDFENLPSKEKIIEYEHKGMEDVQKIIDTYSEKTKVKIRIEKSDEAYYSPLLDEIVLVSEKQYKNFDSFVSTAFHEIIHSTGHSSRLNRIKSTFTENEEYSKEELVAQLGSSLLCFLFGYTNTDTTNNDVNYIRGWLKHLKDNTRELISAGSQAQKAVDYILTITDLKSLVNQE
ncbi:MAG: DUF1738 domain-containing protein [Clostridia bacterium]|nr:DUF1738 domain-containing protein [Clostridia bacterium]